MNSTEHISIRRHQAWLNDWRWSFIVGALVVFVLMAAIVYPSVWRWFGVWHMDPHFADLAAIFAAGEALMVGRDVYAINPFDPLGRPHVYGPWWLVAGPLGLSVDDARWAGPLLVVVFLAAVLAMLKPRGPREAALVGAWLLSAPVLLGLERANNDLVVVILLVAGSWAVGRGGYPARAGAACVVLAAGLKVYPLAALPMLGAMRKRVCWVTLALSVTTSVVIFWIWREDFHRAIAIAPRPATLFSYGFENFAVSWRLTGFRVWIFSAMAAGFALAALQLWRERKGVWELVPLRGSAAAAFAAGACSWILCYFANTNYAYRLVLLTLCMAVLLRPDAGQAGRKLFWGMLIIAWLALPKATFSWDIEQLAYPDDAIRGVVVFSGLEQGLMLVMTMALALALTGWAVRWIKDYRSPPAG